MASPNFYRMLQIEIGIGRHDAYRILSNGPARYKVFEIRKKNGGVRVIAQPSREMKAMQRVILEKFLFKFPVHNIATGYIKKSNIYENANAHKKSEAILKLDFNNFFPSLRVQDWKIYLGRNNIDIDSDDAWILRNMLFWGQGSSRPKCLSIGAPTSPALSNILMYDLDVMLSDLAEKVGVRITRYADDITVSGSTIENIVKFENEAMKIVSNSKSPKLTFNAKKRGIYTRGQRRMVTGLVLTPNYKISLGRQRKRELSSLVHKVSVGAASKVQIAEAKGLLGFAISTEPSFVSRLRQKYGNETIDWILQLQLPKRSVLSNLHERGG